MAVKNRWEQPEWRVEIEQDVFDPETQEAVVSVYIEEFDDEGKPEGDALATPSPGEAREMAKALMVYAYEADKKGPKEV